MIVYKEYQTDLYGNLNPGKNIQYFGKDVVNNEHCCSAYIGLACKSKGKQGVIIGFEQANQWLDYYYIVYIPDTNQVTFELASDKKFINSIFLDSIAMFQKQLSICPININKFIDTSMDIADRLFEYKKKKGLKTSELAKQLGVSTRLVNKYLCGTYDFKLSEILIIEQLLENNN